MKRRRQSRLAHELWAAIGGAETIEDINVAAGVVLERVQKRARRRATTTVLVLTLVVYFVLDSAVVNDDVGLRLSFLAGLF